MDTRDIERFFDRSIPAVDRLRELFLTIVREDRWSFDAHDGRCSHAIEQDPIGSLSPSPDPMCFFWLGKRMPEGHAEPPTTIAVARRLAPHEIESTDPVKGPVPTDDVIQEGIFEACRGWIKVIDSVRESFVPQLKARFATDVLWEPMGDPAHN